MSITISDIAREAGVSVATVSRVINGQYQFMSESTRLRIEEIIKKTGYIPNSLAQGLKGQRTNIIGILISNMAHPFWATVLDGIEQTCRENGYNVLFCNSKDDPELEYQYMTMLQTKQVDGIIINPTGKGIEKFFPLIQRKFPIITLDRKLEALGIRSVGINNVYGALLATEHLLSLGHRRIGIILYELNGLSNREERLQGYREALLKAGIQYNENYIAYVDPNPGNARDATHKLLSLEEPPTALFSTNLQLNISVLAALKQMNIRVPDGVSFVAFDDADWAILLAHPLTTICTPSRRMGVEAALSIIAQIEEKTSDDDNTRGAAIQLTPELIERDSTRRLYHS